MTATIRIDMDNAAFEVEPGTELADILRDLADKVAGVPYKPGRPCNRDLVTLRDSNGNTVGEFRVQ